jgi:hypothetical protein
MAFIVKEKSNLKYILIVVIASFLADALVIAYTYLIKAQIAGFLE